MQRTFRLSQLLLAIGMLPWFMNKADAQATSAPRRQAAVHFSDGKVLEGEVLLTPGINFQLGAVPEPGQKFGQTRTFNVDIVREMSFTPFTRSDLPAERMMVPYKFDDKDRTIRIPTGKPYPVREVACSVKFTSGQELTGVLTSVVLYVIPRDADTGMPGDTQRFILKSKQTGEQMQKMADLVYVTRIRMLDEGSKVAAKLDVKLNKFQLGAGDELAAITRESLEAVPVKKAGNGLFEVSSTFGESVFLAARQGKKYVVGWPAEGTEKTKLYETAEQHVRDLRDYYNERKLLGILPNENGTRVLTLVSLRRRVPPNAFKAIADCEYDENGNPMEFFRVSIWHWKRDVESGTMILIKRGSFFRIRVDVKAPTPVAEITPELWPIERKGNMVTVGN